MEGNSTEVELTTITEENFEELEFRIVSTDNDHIYSMKTDPPTETFVEPKNVENQLYCCNTCNFSFVSITDHLKEYHSGHEVILEIEEEHEITETIIDDTATDIILEEEIPDTLILDENFYGITSNKTVKCIIPDDTIPVESIEKIDSTPKEPKTNNMKLGKYSCVHCNLTYSNNKSYCAHMKIHKNLKLVIENDLNKDDGSVLNSQCVLQYANSNESENFECKICSMVFPNNKSLALHRRMHIGEKKKTTIPLVKPDPEILKVNGSGPHSFYHCSVCSKWIHEDFQVIHDKTHSEVVEYNCSKCNKKMVDEESLKMHMVVHTEDKVAKCKTSKKPLYTCSFCDSSFSRPYDKVKHERIHTGEKPYTCNVCNKSFRLSYCLTLHLRTHTGARPYSCHHCGKKFKSYSVCNHHKRLHSEVRAFKCTMCPKAFKTSVQLNGHKNSHIKPYTCNECNRPFSSLYVVKKHMEKHKCSVMKFKCKQCGASYGRRYALDDHLRIKHSIVQTNGQDSEPETEMATDSILQESDSE